MNHIEGEIYESTTMSILALPSQDAGRKGGLVFQNLTATLSVVYSGMSRASCPFKHQDVREMELRLIDRMESFWRRKR